MRLIGAHVPAAGGLAGPGLRYAAAVGAEAVQVFTANPRGWAPGPGDPAAAAAGERLAAAGLPVFVHAPYLVNPGSPDPLTWERSAAAIRLALHRGALLGARGVIVHAGSAVGASRPAGLARAAACLLPILAGIAVGGPDLLIEPMAGQGSMLCGTIAELGPYLDALGWHPRAGICLDTCHLFGAGHDLSAPDGAGLMLDALEQIAPGRLRLVHANDARDPCGSHRDRHENIGAGRIGTRPFARMLAHPATAGVPFIVETPGGERGHAADVARLLRLR